MIKLKKQHTNSNVPEVKEYFKWLNGMNAKGLLDPESFTQKEDAYRAKLATGNVLGITDPNWEFQEAATSLVKDGKAERTWAPQPITLNDTIQSAGMRDVGYTGGWGVGITTAAKNPQRACRFSRVFIFRCRSSTYSLGN